MPLTFRLAQRIGGFTVAPIAAGENGWICQRELIGPADPAHLGDRLEKFQAVLFSLIPGLPPPSQIDHLLVIINQDLSATAYVNELTPTANVRVNRAVAAGEAIRVQDIDDIALLELGVPVPADAAVVMLRSFGWRRSLFFDLGPMGPNGPTRDYELEAILAQQALLLLGLPIASATAQGRTEPVNDIETPRAQ